MKNIILAPDSFKGSLSAIDLCNLMEEEIRVVFPDCAVISLPIADGGEGTVDAFLRAVPGTRFTVQVSGPFSLPIDADYALLDQGKTAVIEMAAAAGLPLAAGRGDPSVTTTYGVGQLMRHAIERGARRLLIGLGGSCTNDGGCGMAAALGVRFLTQDGTPFIPTGGTLHEIRRIDIAPAQALLDGVTVTAMCDVKNPLHGPQGAAHIFAPQKGADVAMVARLDDGLRHYGACLEALPQGKGVQHLPGAGAAGGLGAGLCALIGASLTPGIDTVLDTVGFDALLEGCDLVITGEGKLDHQSLTGKAAIGVARRAALQKVPIVALAGAVDDAILPQARAQGITAAFSIQRGVVSLEEAMARTEASLRATVGNLMALIGGMKVK